MLDEALKEQLAQYLKYLRRPVQITAALDDSATSAAVRELLAQIAAASSLVRLVDTPDAGAGVRRPSFAIHQPDEAPRVRFAGLPLGHEFTSLVLALLHVGLRLPDPVHGPGGLRRHRRR